MEDRRTSKEIAEEIRRGEREYEQCLAEGKAKILEVEKELFELQKKMISDMKASIFHIPLPDHVKLEMVLKVFKGKDRMIEPERIKSIWYGV